MELKPHSEPLAETSEERKPKRHYLIDLEYGVEQKTRFGRIPHLSVLNPGTREAKLAITVFYPDHKPRTFERLVPALTSSESDARSWPVRPNSRFALQIESSELIVAQATQGWNNTGNNYSSKMLMRGTNRPRETAKSYMAVSSLGKEYYIADGIVIDAPDKIWIRETEDMVILNPGKTELNVILDIYYGKRRAAWPGLRLEPAVVTRSIKVSAERLALVAMKGWVRPNRHYGARISGDQIFAAQWLRRVYWYDSAELMSEWSVPCDPMA